MVALLIRACDRHELQGSGLNSSEPRESESELRFFGSFHGSASHDSRGRVAFEVGPSGLAQSTRDEGMLAAMLTFNILFLNSLESRPVIPMYLDLRFKAWCSSFVPSF